MHEPPARTYAIARLALLALFAACSGRDGARVVPAEQVAHADSTARAPAGVVDSILPVEEELRRFRAPLGPAPSAFDGGAATREALVDSFAVAVARGDSAALARLVITRAEFAWLVYPGSAYTRPPFRQSPQLVWMQLADAGATGESRLLRRLGHRPLRLAGHSCDPAPDVSGETRLWRGCVARVEQPDGSVHDERLFGVIVERDGRYKFASLANRM